MTQEAQAAIRAVKDRLANARDDLARARLQQCARPDWKDGNDIPISEIVVAYRHQVNDLEDALAWLQKL